MAKFVFESLDRFQGSRTKIKRPVEIGCFSYTEDHQLVLDASSLKYYYTPRLGASLSQGFSAFKKLDDSCDEHLDSLLAAIVKYEREAQTRVSTDFMTWRGIMTKIMTAPYAGRYDSFEMNATKFQGTIFLEEDHDFKVLQREAQSSQRPRHQTVSQDLMSFWGYKFESLCLLPNPWDATPRDFIESREQHVVSNYAQYCSVVRTGFGDTELILAGEIDGVWDVKSAEPISRPTQWVELKTSAEISSAKDFLKFERKLNKFWAQSFLLGVPKIIVGFRGSNAEGELLRVQEMETTKIPGMVKRDGQASWDGNLCVNFTASCLDFLKQNIAGEGVWKLRLRRGCKFLELYKAEETGTGDILSRDFLDWRSKASG